jgi:hypothetical protein
MRANINPETGIPYGVIDARKCQWLWETIVNDGRDVTLEMCEEQVRKDLTENLSYELGTYQVDVGSFVPDGNTQFFNFLLPLLSKVPAPFQTPESIRDFATDIVQNRYDPVSNTFCISEVIDYIWEYYQDDLLQHCQDDTSEHTFSWTDPTKRFSYQVSSLGGAPLIWVFKSPYVTPCRQCSPCVPNAGNLDDMMELGAHNCLAYCMDPEEIDDVVARPKVMYYAAEYPQTDKPITYLKTEETTQ